MRGCVNVEAKQEENQTFEIEPSETEYIRAPIKSRVDQLMNLDVAIVGYGETPVRTRSQTPMAIEEYIASAARIALDSASLNKHDIENQGLGVIGTGSSNDSIWAARVAEHLGLSPKWLISSHHGGASSLILLVESALAIHAGIVDTVLCICADTPTQHRATRSDYAVNLLEPFGAMGPITLMAMFARRYFHQYEAKPESLSNIAISQRQNASLNPLAVFSKPLELQDYLQSKMVVEPLRLLDVPMPVDGACAYVVSSLASAKKYCDIPIRLLGFGQAFNYRAGSYNHCDITSFGVKKASREALDASGVPLESLSCLQTYDESTITALIQLEDIGYCQKGEAWRFVESHDLRWNGDVPMNTCGGLLSAGQRGFAGGSIQLIEGVRQLRHEGERRQVKNAETTLVTGLGGLNYGATLNTAAAVVLGR